MVIKVTAKHLQAIQAHAESTYPDECCGFLMGEIAGDVKTLVEVWPTENAWNPEVAEALPEIESGDKLERSRRDRFVIAPSAMLKAMKQGRDRHLTIIGIYHSHPEHPAIPSECDRALAWPQYSYIIVSVYQGKVQDLRNWSLDGEGNFQSEEIITLQSAQVKK